MQRLEKLVNNTLNLDISSGVAYATSGSAIIVGALGLSDWLAIGGFFFIVLTYFTNLYFKVTDRKHNIREKKRRK